ETSAAAARSGSARSTAAPGGNRASAKLLAFTTKKVSLIEGPIRRVLQRRGHPETIGSADQAKQGAVAPPHPAPPRRMAGGLERGARALFSRRRAGAPNGCARRLCDPAEIRRRGRPHRYADDLGHLVGMERSNHAFDVSEARLFRFQHEPELARRFA